MGDLVELSINSMVGFIIPKTMKIKGVVVFINYGKTYNFISEESVNCPGLATTEKSHYNVFMGKTMLVQGGGDCKGVVVSLPRLTWWRTSFH